MFRSVSRSTRERELSFYVDFYDIARGGGAVPYVENGDVASYPCPLTVGLCIASICLQSFVKQCGRLPVRRV